MSCALKASPRADKKCPGASKYVQLEGCSAAAKFSWKTGQSKALFQSDPIFIADIRVYSFAQTSALARRLRTLVRRTHFIIFLL